MVTTHALTWKEHSLSNNNILYEPLLIYYLTVTLCHSATVLESTDYNRCIKGNYDTYVRFLQVSSASFFFGEVADNVVKVNTLQDFRFDAHKRQSLTSLLGHCCAQMILHSRKRRE